MTVHRTPVEAAAVHASGWVRLPGTDREISRLPLIDTRHKLATGEPIFARLDYKTALEWMKLHKCELPTRADFDAVRKIGLVLKPVNLWTKKDGTPATFEAAERHDALVYAQLHAASWLPTEGDPFQSGEPVTGAGKCLCAGASKGKCRICGWYVPNVATYGSKRTGPGWVQEGTTDIHGDDHVDYATLCCAVRIVGASEPPPDTDPAPKSGTGWIESVAAAVTDALGPVARVVATAFRCAECGAMVPLGTDDDLSTECATCGEKYATATPAPAAKGPREISDRLTPGTSQSVYDALARAWRTQIGTEPRRTSLLLLCAQWALETGWGKSSHCNNLGNVRAKPNGSRSWCYYAANEIILNDHARALVAKAKPRRDGKGPDAVITHTGEKTSTIWFYPDSDGACFRAFDTLDEGAADYLEILRKRFTLAWAEVERGDPAAFGHALKAQNFYTAPADDWVDSKGKTQRGYVSSLVSLVKSLGKTIA